MGALAALLLDCSKADLATFAAELATVEAALRCAVAAGAAATQRGNAAQRSTLWGELLPAAFKAIRKLGELGENATLRVGMGVRLKWQAGGTRLLGGACIGARLLAACC